MDVVDAGVVREMVGVEHRCRAKHTCSFVVTCKFAKLMRKGELRRFVNMVHVGCAEYIGGQTAGASELAVRA